MTFGPTTPGWDERGCRDVPTSAFYPIKEGGSQLDPRARAACERCPMGVRAACLEDALAESDNRDMGWRANTSAKTRRAIRKSRRRRRLGGAA